MYTHIQSLQHSHEFFLSYSTFGDCEASRKFLMDVTNKYQQYYSKINAKTPPVASYISSLFLMFAIYFRYSRSTEQRLEGSILDQRWKVDIRLFSLEMALRFLPGR